ncbi:hypothetical protein [Chryseobacterium shigense]|nr:hypothetical protein [Chryseobacterium shigense]
MKKNLILGILLLPLLTYSQVGISTPTPQKNLHVNGSLQITNELNLGGDAIRTGSAGRAGQVLKSNGPGAVPTWENLAGVPNDTGTVIAVNGQFIVAQEIVVQMTADYVLSASVDRTYTIENLTNVIIDNQNNYFSSARTNLFTVKADGIYEVIMNVQLSTDNGKSPVIGIWDSTTNSWVAMVNDYFTAPTGHFQTYTLITSIPMLASGRYSFRVAPDGAGTTIRYLSSGSTGSGPVTQMSVKRLK